MSNESTEVAVRMTEEALVAAATADLETDVSELRIPRLKVAQSLTREVSEGEAAVGDLVHSLTGEVYGDSVKLIIVDAFKGRFWKDPETKKAHSAGRGEPNVPWEEHSCYGTPFVDCPDAEERFREDVRANLKDWGRGPGISTTYNFVGLLIAEDGEVETFPVNVSLMRAAAKEARNWQTMLNIARAPWDSVYELSTYKAQSKSGEPYTAVRVKPARKTTPEERQQAVTIAQAIHAGNAKVTVDQEGGEDAPVAPAPTGGLADTI